MNLADAFEGKVYGNYFWINLNNQKYWEVEPKICKVTMPTGEEKRCNSDDGWNEFVKAYMEAP